jgi:hypothetical protein
MDINTQKKSKSVTHSFGGQYFLFLSTLRFDFHSGLYRKDFVSRETDTSIRGFCSPNLVWSDSWPGGSWLKWAAPCRDEADFLDFAFQTSSWPLLERELGVLSVGKSIRPASRHGSALLRG